MEKNANATRSFDTVQNYASKECQTEVGRHYDLRSLAFPVTDEGVDMKDDVASNSWSDLLRDYHNEHPSICERHKPFNGKNTNVKEHDQGRLATSAGSPSRGLHRNLPQSHTVNPTRTSVTTLHGREESPILDEKARRYNEGEYPLEDRVHQDVSKDGKSLAGLDIDNLADRIASKLSMDGGRRRETSIGVEAFESATKPVDPGNLVPPGAPPQSCQARSPLTAPPREIQPEKFQLGQDWDVYVNSFHEIALYNQWDTFTAAQRLKFSLGQPALEMAHNVAKLPPGCSFGQLVTMLSPIFGSVYKEGRAATLFEQRRRQPEESYQDYMLALFKLFNQAYPEENQVSKFKRISKRFILGLGDADLAQYLADQTYSGPMELVKLAEKRQCLFMELRSANKAGPVVADVEESDSFKAFQEGNFASNRPWNRPPQRLHPDDLKAIGETVSQSIGSKLTQHKGPPYRGQPYKGRRWQPNPNPDKAVTKGNNPSDDPSKAGQAKSKSEVPKTPPGNEQGRGGKPTTPQS